MMKLSFQRCNLNYCIYFKEIFVEMVYLALYVDDILIANKSIDQTEVLKHQLK